MFLISLLFDDVPGWLVSAGEAGTKRFLEVWEAGSEEGVWVDELRGL